MNWLGVEYDLSFVDIGFELWAIENAFDESEIQLQHLLTEKDVRLKAWLMRQPGDWNDPDLQDAIQSHDTLTEDVYPRFFRNGCVVSLWATYEAGLKEAAEYTVSNIGRESSLTGKSGNEVLQEARKLFADVLQLNLAADANRWNTIKHFLAVRNALAHANGRLDPLRPKLKAEVLRATKELDGLELKDDCLVIGEGCVRNFICVVRASLDDLLSRVRKRWPTRGRTDGTSISS